MTVQDVVIGLLAIGVGAMFCFRGAVAMRIVITLWGVFAGFMLGAAAVAGADGTGFLRTTMGWLLGSVLGLVFGSLAYLFFEVAIILTMASIGFTLGTTLMVALGFDWSWVIVLVGVAVGVLFAAWSLSSNLPLVLLVLLSAFSGASAMITGVMLLVGTVDATSFTRAEAMEQMHTSWWWYASYAVLAVVGMISQFSFLESIRGSARDHWHAAPRV